MIYFLFITAFTVSIDSFVCGFSLAMKNGKKLPIVIGIALTVLIMCLFANYLTYLFHGFLTEKTASLGGLILIFVGLYNLVKKDDDKIKNGNVLKQSLISGFAVGLDGACANLSLAIMGLNQFYVPIVIALMHALTISLGVALAKTPFVTKFKKLNFIPPLILILLGLYKLLGFFI